MVNVVVGEFIIIFFEVVKEEGLKGNELVRGGIKERKCGSTTREVRVLDVFREFGDNKFLDGVLNVDAIREGVGDEGAVSVTRGGGDGIKDESREGRVGEGIGGSSGVEVVYDVVRGAVKLELVDSKGHIRYSWGAEGRDS